MPPIVPQPKSIAILSGAGLSVASGIPTFRDAGGLWEGHAIEEVATPSAWERQPALVRRFYDERRITAAALIPNPAHFALTRLQQRLGESRVSLITQNVDGMLHRAGAPNVIEMHGSINRLRCTLNPTHPRTGVFGNQNPAATCSVCNASLRPDIVWFGEEPYLLDEIERAVIEAEVFLSVGTSGTVYPANALVDLAKANGATTIEINPQPTSAEFDLVIAQVCEEALPQLIARWLDEDND